MSHKAGTLERWRYYVRRDSLRVYDRLFPAFRPTEVVADVFASIGRACATATNLSRNGLRKSAYPLDWMMTYGLDVVLHLFQTGFSTFFKDIAEEGEPVLHCRRVVDKNTGMAAIHHFPLNMPFQQSVEFFWNKTGPRIDRMLNHFEQAGHICLVSNREDDIDVLQDFALKFHEIYPKRLSLINVRHSGKRAKHERHPSDSVSLIDYSVSNETLAGDEWKGNKYEWRKALSGCRLTGRIAFDSGPGKGPEREKRQ